jgi:hypothetical protein
MVRKHWVIDQNVLRDEVGPSERSAATPRSLLGYVTSAEHLGEQIVLPDVAILELCRSNDPVQGLIRSLRGFRRVPSLISMGHSIGALMRNECETGIPTSESGVIDSVATAGIREILREISVSEVEARLLIMKRLKNIVFDEQRVRPPDYDFGHLTKQCDALGSMFFERRLRNKSGNHESKIEFCQSKVFRDIVISQVKAVYRGPAGGYSQLMGRSVLYRFILARTLLVLRREPDLRASNPTKPSPKKIANDVADIDYIVTALSCRDLLTGDKKMKADYEIIKECEGVT